ncbi:MAG: DUF1643 domain-containing protein [Gammaproteobacteria bacterium]
MQYVSQNARISSCGNYRYSLDREWSTGAGSVLFIGLNPSTADHQQDDPTIRRCVGFARSWGFKRMEIVNLFAFRATFPADLKQAADPVGPENDKWITLAHDKARLTVACWGNDGEFQQRAAAVSESLPDIHCLRLNKTRQPAHPLYLKANLRPQPFQYRAESP